MEFPLTILNSLPLIAPAPLLSHQVGLAEYDQDYGVHFEISQTSAEDIVR